MEVALHQLQSGGFASYLASPGCSHISSVVLFPVFAKEVWMEVCHEAFPGQMPSKSRTDVWWCSGADLVGQMYRTCCRQGLIGMENGSARPCPAVKSV